MGKRIARNQGRIEFISCKEIINELIDKGYDKRKIHKLLSEENKITMSYATFCYQNSHYKEKNKDSSPKNLHKFISSEKNESFTSPKDVDQNSII